MAQKLRAVREAGDRRVIVVAGSNAWYSIDASLMAQRLHRPVVNAAVHFGLAKAMVERVSDEVRSGDLVLLPLEYEQYQQPDSLGTTEACYLLFDHFRSPSWSLGWFSAFNSCPLKLERLAPVVRRFSIPQFREPDLSDVMTPIGDRLHTDAELASWRGGWKLNVAGAMAEIREPRLEAAILKMKARGAHVAISFPVQPSESVADVRELDVWRKLIEQWAHHQGVQVVSSPQLHLFPDSCFLDTPYHLHSGCRAQNTERYAAAISAMTLSRP
ncbi:hypothetical protein L6654_08605 [Bradyrhizobium sp. WYCCWR 13023]|uniref:Uncharacterized protein n=1 Tax=Bradyrhizobium zhengyangense TaxID=2911009 RepID=A0A9X1RAI6_9BRAD|nr:hypothetical protein [Bradyrhizobium zhengyangense]MCG2626680.1 hypothetical protein [Bradyrhizobium zhengyangense]